MPKDSEINLLDASPPLASPPDGSSPNTPVSTSSPKNSIAYIVMAVSILLLCGALALYYVLINQPANGDSPTPTSNQQSTSSAEPTVTTNQPDCQDGQEAFANTEFGAAFCYPAGWGAASVTDAKIDPSDAGYRQSITFGNNPYVSVGGASDDWSTTVGRGVGCLEPNNQTVDLADYDTAWHNIQGEGDDVSYAMRSLPSVTGGYDLTEQVGNQILSGICTSGHKVIDGSRYRVAYVAFSRDFAPASGISTPRQHMDNPEVLFNTEQRANIQLVLSTLQAY